MNKNIYWYHINIFYWISLFWLNKSISWCHIKILFAIFPEHLFFQNTSSGCFRGLLEHWLLLKILIISLLEKCQPQNIVEGWHPPALPFPSSPFTLPFRILSFTVDSNINSTVAIKKVMECVILKMYCHSIIVIILRIW